MMRWLAQAGTAYCRLEICEDQSPGYLVVDVSKSNVRISGLVGNGLRGRYRFPLWLADG